MPQKRVHVITSCRLWRMFWRMILIWLLALTAALIIKICEEAAFGAVLHGRFIGNMVAVMLLGGAIDGTVMLFQAGWLRFNEYGYGIHVPWRGLRSGGRWEDVNFIGLVPGNTVGTRFSVAVLIVSRQGKTKTMEYRKGLIQKLLELCPDLRVAALADSRKVTAICHQLDEEEIGWLPLAWVQHIDGSGELVLRTPVQKPVMSERNESHG